MQWFIGNLQNTFSLITKVSKVDTDQNVWEVQSAISGPKCPKQQWRQFLSKENVSPGNLYQEGSLRNVDSTRGERIIRYSNIIRIVGTEY